MLKAETGFHHSISAQSSSVFHRLFRDGVIFFSLLASLHNTLFNSAPPLGGLQGATSPGTGEIDIPSIRRFISVGASVVQAHGPAQGLFFQACSAYGGLKTSAFPPCLGHCLLCGVSNPYKRHVCCWLGWGAVVSLWLSPFLPPSVTPVGSAGPLLPSLSQSAWAYVPLPITIIFSLTGRQVIWKGTTLNFMGRHSYRDIAVLEDVHCCHQSVLWHSGNCRGT